MYCTARCFPLPRHRVVNKSRRLCRIHRTNLPLAFFEPTLIMTAIVFQVHHLGAIGFDGDRATCGWKAFLSLVISGLFYIQYNTHKLNECTCPQVVRFGSCL